MGKRILQIFTLLITTAIIIITASAKDRERRAQLESIASEKYDSVFLSMFPIDNYELDVFTEYCGLNPFISSYCIQDAVDMNDFLNSVFTSGNRISIAYIGIDPYQIWSYSESNLMDYYDSLKLIMSYTAAFPEVEFKFLLPYPSMEEWLSQPEGSLEQAMEYSALLIQYFKEMENVSIFYYGDQKWLIENPGNYTDSRDANSEVSKLILLTMNREDKYWIHAGNMEARFTALTDLVESRRANPPRYPDYSGKSFVFMGDSIMVYLQGSLSIPSVVGSLTGADTYNFGYGGGNASLMEGQDFSFPGIVDSLLTGDLSPLVQNESLGAIVTDFRRKDIESESLCFFISFGLNDYFNGSPLASDDPYDISTYTGAIRTGVERLKKAYPDSTFVLLTPTFTSFFNNGMEKNGSAGGILTAYVEAVLSLAEELDVKCINNYEELGIHEDNSQYYLSDGCHPNETGGFYMGNHIIDRLETWILPQNRAAAKR